HLIDSAERIMTACENRRHSNIINNRADIVADDIRRTIAIKRKRQRIVIEDDILDMIEGKDAKPSGQISMNPIHVLRWSPHFHIRQELMQIPVLDDGTAICPEILPQSEAIRLGFLLVVPFGKIVDHDVNESNVASASLVFQSVKRSI